LPPRCSTFFSGLYMALKARKRRKNPEPINQERLPQ